MGRRSGEVVLSVPREKRPLATLKRSSPIGRLFAGSFVMDDNVDEVPNQLAKPLGVVSFDGFAKVFPSFGVNLHISVPYGIDRLY